MPIPSLRISRQKKKRAETQPLSETQHTSRFISSRKIILPLILASITLIGGIFAYQAYAHLQAQMRSLQLAALSNETGNPETAALLSIAALRTAYTPEADAMLNRAMIRLPDVRFEYLETTGRIFGSHVLTNNRLVVWAIDNYVPSTIQLRDHAGNLLRTLNGADQRLFNVLEFSDGGFVGFGNDKLLIWSYSGELERVVSVGQMINIGEIMVLDQVVRNANNAPRSDHIIVTLADGLIEVRNRDGSIVNTLSAEDPVRGAIELIDGRILALYGMPYLIIWGKDGSQLRLSSEAPILSAIQLTNGDILTWGDHHSPQLWNSSGQLLRQFSNIAPSPTNIIELQNGNLLVVRGDFSFDSELTVWSQAGTFLRPLQIEPNTRNTLRQVSQADDGSIWALLNDTLTYWHQDGQRQHTYRYQRVNGFKLLPNSRVVGWYGQFLFFETGNTYRDPTPRVNPIIRRQSDGRSIVHRQEGNLEFLNSTGAIITQISIDPTFRIIPLDDDRIVVFGSSLCYPNNSVPLMLYNGTGSFVHEMTGQTCGVSNAIGLSDGRIVTSTHNGILRLWGIEGDLIKTWEAHENNFNGIERFSQDRLLSWSEDGTFKLWSADGNLISSVSISVPSFGRYARGQPGGTLGLRNGDILLWQTDSSLHRWQPDTGEINVLVDDTSHRLQALQTHDGRILVWSTSGQMTLFDENYVELKSDNSHWGAVAEVIELRDGRFATRGTCSASECDYTFRLFTHDLEAISVAEFRDHLTDGIGTILELSDGSFALRSFAGSLIIVSPIGQLERRIPSYVLGATQLLEIEPGSLLIIDNSGNSGIRQVSLEGQIEEICSRITWGLGPLEREEYDIPENLSICPDNPVNIPAYMR